VPVVSLRSKIGCTRADVPLSITLDARIASMRERSLWMIELESQKTQIKKVLLREVLDLASELQATVDLHGLSVAEVARPAGIAERDAQRLYKLPVDAIRRDIAAGEAKYGATYRYPAWRTLVTGYKPVSNGDNTPSATTYIYDGGGTKTAAMPDAAKQARLLETERQIVAEVQQGKKANKEVLAALEQEQADLRRSTALPAKESVPKCDFDNLQAELEAERSARRDDEQKHLARIAELEASQVSYYQRHFQGGNDERPTPQYI
jgi:hypothetical protein